MKRVLATYLVLLFSCLSYGQEEEPDFVYSAPHWEPHYDITSMEPYGGFILQELVIDNYDWDYFNVPIAEHFEKNQEDLENTVLLTYGFDLHWRYRDYKAVLEFVRSGNEALIICEEIPKILEREFSDSTWYEAIESEIVVSGNDLDNVSLAYVSDYVSYDYSWKFITENSNPFRASKTLLKDGQGRTVMEEIQIGDGKLYFCSVPLLFSNYQLKSNDGSRIVDWLFDLLDGDYFLIDNYSGFEKVIYYQLGSSSIRQSTDTDNDGLSDEEEGDKDSDGDGIPDKEESNTMDRDADGQPDNEDTDSDNDGIEDGEEGNKDTDDDGVLDRNESNTEDDDGDGKTNHEDPDSDGDGVNDGDESGNSSSSDDSADSNDVNIQPSESPLEHLLTDRSLLWAYLLLMIMGLLYIVFKSKRKQRIIPLIERDANSSKEFVETVSSLYLSKGQHRSLAVQKRKNFLHFVRHRYHINTSEMDDKFAQRLSKNSGISMQDIKEIIENFKSLESNKSYGKSQLLKLHKLIEKFHTNCK